MTTSLYPPHWRMCLKITHLKASICLAVIVFTAAAVAPPRCCLEILFWAILVCAAEELARLGAYDADRTEFFRRLKANFGKGAAFATGTSCHDAVKINSCTSSSMILKETPFIVGVANLLSRAVGNIWPWILYRNNWNKLVRLLHLSFFRLQDLPVSF